MTADAFATYIAEGLTGVLRDAGQMVQLGDPGFIQSGTPVSLPGKIIQAAARQACRRYADNPTGLRAGARPKAEKACRPYLSAAAYGGAGPKLIRPFSGGQCLGSVYAVSGTWGDIGTGGNPITWGPVNVNGIIQGAENRAAESGRPDRRDIWVLSSAGPDVRIVIDAFFQNALPTVITSISLVSGSNDCGSPEPVFTPPVPPGSPGPPFEPFNPDSDTNVDIGIEVNPDGTITIDIGTGPIDIDPFGDEPGTGGGSQTPVAPGDTGAAGTPTGTGVGGTEEGEAPPGQILVGLKLDMLAAPPGAKQFASGVYRGGAYVRMGTPVGLDQDYAGAMLTDGQFVFAEKDFLTRWRVTANPGYNWRVTPYYREVE
jgi:hypothetical protein